MKESHLTKLTKKDEDIVLVRRAQKGDYEAFNLLVLKYQSRIISLAHKFVKDIHLAEDIAQESFIKAHKSINSFREESAFYTWLYRVTVNTAKNYLSSKQRKKEMSISEIADPDEHNLFDKITADSPEDILTANNLREVIFNSFSSLPEEIRTALSLREFEGLGYEEIAKILDCPIGTVRSRIFRGREQIAELIRPIISSSFMNSEKKERI